ADCIEELLGKNGLEGNLKTVSNPIPLFKESLKACDATTRENFESGFTAHQLTALRSAFIDRLLGLAWLQFFPASTDNLALVAVGGYGRGELFPASDVDLLMLVEKKTDQSTLDGIQKFLTFLWDIGLEVGHSVRTIRDSVDEAKADITVITNIMEARHLEGSMQLFHDMQIRCGPKRIWSSRSFFNAKLEEQTKRYARFDETAYKLEPNIKESPGGLRDIQMIGWIAKRHFNAKELEELIQHGYLTPEEYSVLSEGLEYLGKIRVALHLLTGRREDRLLFDHQFTLAKQFGFVGKDNQAIESFMQQYYRTVMELQRLGEMLIQHFQEATLKPSRWKITRTKKINKRFQSRGNYIEVTYDQVFEHYPFALLEIFLLLQQFPNLKGARATTIRLMRDNRHRIDDKFRQDARAKAYFIEILRQPRGITHVLRRMNRYGILAAYLPEFGNIVGRMQYDLFHIYTVDEHTLYVVRNLRRFTVPEFTNEFPLCSSIMKMLPKPELVYIAGLYHDIAKGRGGDHSILGAEDARAFCLRHGLSQYDTNLVSWLVKNHLLMSSTSQKFDVNDPDVVKEFSEFVGDTNHLNYLYVLTVADMRGTNPSLWNSWKANLLNGLYNNSMQLLRKGIGSIHLLEERQAAMRMEAEQTLLTKEYDSSQIEAIWARFPDDYFFRHSAREIIWHTSLIIDNSNTDQPVIESFTDEQKGATSIFVYAKESPKFFAKCAAALDQMGLNILEARILSTKDDHTLNTFTVHDENGQSIKDSHQIKLVRQHLKSQLQEEDQSVMAVTRRVPRQLKHFTIPTQISFELDEVHNRTIMNIVTGDKPGLLSLIGQAFLQCHIQIENARIATFGERVEDVFYIVNDDGTALKDPEDTTRLHDAISRQLDDQEAA
ncbi:MAG: [protein-PII] uridylyltransferase, partial [Gammaproteobacteria bacterium]